MLEGAATARWMSVARPTSLTRPTITPFALSPGATGSRWAFSSVFSMRNAKQKSAGVDHEITPDRHNFRVTFQAKYPVGRADTRGRIRCCPFLKRSDSKIFETLDGLLLSGGPDLDPDLYRQTPHPLTNLPETKRDRLEVALLRKFYSRGIPILGVCRGMEMINVFLGGTLNQHVAHPGRHHHKFAAGNTQRFTP